MSATHRGRVGSDRPAEATDALDVVESQSAVLVRNFELLRRRADVYGALDRSSYLLLRALDVLGPADINTLATAVGLDPSTVGRQIAAMQAKKLVDRTAAAEDRRRSIVAPTATGRHEADRVRRQRRRDLAALLDGWTGDELATLGEMFTRYNRAVAVRYLGADTWLSDPPDPDR